MSINFQFVELPEGKKINFKKSTFEVKYQQLKNYMVQIDSSYDDLANIVSSFSGNPKKLSEELENFRMDLRFRKTDFHLMNFIIEDSHSLQSPTAPSLLKIFIGFLENYNEKIFGTAQEQILRFYNNMFYYSCKCGVLNLITYELIEHFIQGEFFED